MTNMDVAFLTIFDWQPKVNFGYQSRKKVDQTTKIGQIWWPLCIVVTIKTAQNVPGYYTRQVGNKINMKYNT